jgi:hypothetical protein
MPWPRISIAAWLIACALAGGCLATTSAPAGPVAVTAPPTPAAPPVSLPNREGSLKFGVIGDFGDGSRAQYELADQMAKLQLQFRYELVVTVGDNLYGGNGPRDFLRKFETPYKPLLDAGVKFYASLGNHDSRLQTKYAPFNMNGQAYYTFKAPQQDVRFFAIDSGYLVPEQLAWLEKELQGSSEAWKIPYFHHPLYSSGGRHGSDEVRRKVLEPLFIKHGVSVVLTGHDHIYERTVPQNGIVYFVTGSGGKLRRGNLNRRTGLTAAANDQIQAFMAAEIIGDEMTFNVVSRAGQIIDSGVIRRRQAE